MNRLDLIKAMIAAPLAGRLGSKVVAPAVDAQGGSLVPPEFVEAVLQKGGMAGPSLRVNFDPDYTIEDCLRDRGLERSVEG